MKKDTINKICREGKQPKYATIQFLGNKQMFISGLAQRVMQERYVKFLLLKCKETYRFVQQVGGSRA
jgi:hypothetical protein